MAYKDKIQSSAPELRMLEGQASKPRISDIPILTSPPTNTIAETMWKFVEFPLTQRKKSTFDLSELDQLNTIHAINAEESVGEYFANRWNVKAVGDDVKNLKSLPFDSRKLSEAGSLVSSDSVARSPSPTSQILPSTYSQSLSSPSLSIPAMPTFSSLSPDASSPPLSSISSSDSSSSRAFKLKLVNSQHIINVSFKAIQEVPDAHIIQFYITPSMSVNAIIGMIISELGLKMRFSDERHEKVWRPTL